MGEPFNPPCVITTAGASWDKCHSLLLLCWLNDVFIDAKVVNYMFYNPGNGENILDVSQIYLIPVILYW